MERRRGAGGSAGLRTVGLGDVLDLWIVEASDDRLRVEFRLACEHRSDRLLLVEQEIGGEPCEVQRSQREVAALFPLEASSDIARQARPVPITRGRGPRKNGIPKRAKRSGALAISAGP